MKCSSLKIHFIHSLLQSPDHCLKCWHWTLWDHFVLSKEGYKYVLTMQDAFSSWIEAMPLMDQTSDVIARALFNVLITQFGVPRYILSDQEQNFCSALIKELCSLLKSTKAQTTTYHPTGNFIKRSHRTIKQKLSINVHRYLTERLAWIFTVSDCSKAKENM